MSFSMVRQKVSHNATNGRHAQRLFHNLKTRRRGGTPSNMECDLSLERYTVQTLAYFLGVCYGQAVLVPVA